MRRFIFPQFMKANFVYNQQKPILFEPPVFIRHHPPVGTPTVFDDREPQNRGNTLTKEQIDRIVFDRIKNSHRVVYGSRALVKQIPKSNRKTEDIDVYSNRPLEDMDEIEDSFDEAAGGDEYFERTLEFRNAREGHKKTYQVVDRKTGKSVVDFSQKPRDVAYVKIDDAKYEELKYMREKLKSILHDYQTTNERRKKVRNDLRIIDAFLKENGD